MIVLSEWIEFIAHKHQISNLFWLIPDLWSDVCLSTSLSLEMAPVGNTKLLL